MENLCRALIRSGVTRIFLPFVFFLLCTSSFETLDPEVHLLPGDGCQQAHFLEHPHHISNIHILMWWSDETTSFLASNEITSASYYSCTPWFEIRWLLGVPDPAPKRNKKWLIFCSSISLWVSENFLDENPKTLKFFVRKGAEKLQLPPLLAATSHVPPTNKLPFANFFPCSISWASRVLSWWESKDTESVDQQKLLVTKWWWETLNFAPPCLQCHTSATTVLIQISQSSSTTAKRLSELLHITYLAKKFHWM